VMPRQSGKDILAWNLCMKKCIEKKITICYACPTVEMAFHTFWYNFLEYKNENKDFLRAVSDINLAKMRIDFCNGSVFRVVVPPEPCN